MRMIAVYHKGEPARYISHLDVQRTLHRAFRRANLPIAFSQGFNPHPQISFASALSTGMAGDAEWFDVQLASDMEPQEFLDRVNAVMPMGLSVSDAFVAPEGFGTLASKLAAAEYIACVAFDRPVAGEALSSTIDTMLGGEIMMNKRTKSGIKPVDIRPQILGVFVTGIEGNQATLRVLGKLQADGGLRMELLLDALYDRLDARGTAKVTRTAMYFASDGPLPRLN